MHKRLKVILYILIFYPLFCFAAEEKHESKMYTQLSEKFSPQDNQLNKNKKYLIKENSIHLTLEDTIIRTLENNLTIAVENFNSKVKSEAVVENQSEFDANFEINLSVDEKTQQQASAFSSPNKSRSKNHNWDLSLTQKLVTGADYQLSFTNKKK